MSDIETPVPTLPQVVELLDFTVITGLKIHSQATIVLSVDGERKIGAEAEKGNGPIDAAAEAIKQIIPHDLGCDIRFEVIGTGTSARCNTHVCLSCGVKIFTAEYEDPNPIIAAVTAYIAALNKYLQHAHS